MVYFDFDFIRSSTRNHQFGTDTISNTFSPVRWTRDSRQTDLRAPLAIRTGHRRSLIRNKFVDRRIHKTKRTAIIVVIVEGGADTYILYLNVP